MFGRQMRDGIPVVPGKYNPRNTWKELLEHREKALARRHVAHHEAWSEHTKKLPPLPVGTKVFIQNQAGNNPMRWERTGTVVETKDHDQYNVRVDRTGRLTLRNRRFLRSFTPIVRSPPTTGPQSTNTTPEPVHYLTSPVVHPTPEQDLECSSPDLSYQEPPAASPTPPPSPTADATHPISPGASTPISPGPQITPAPPQAPWTPLRLPTSNRPHLIRKPNSLLDKDM